MYSTSRSIVSLFAALLTLMVYIFLSRYFIRGLMAGFLNR